ILACAGSRPPFLRLQGEHAATTFSQVVAPPQWRGITWSNVRSSGAPQYWHWKRSRRKTLNRVNAGLRDGFTYVLRLTTLGTRIENDGDDTQCSYSATMCTRSRNTALMASCHDHSDNG